MMGSALDSDEALGEEVLWGRTRCGVGKGVASFDARMATPTSARDNGLRILYYVVNITDN
jgi:hypothetical protein